MTMPKIGIAAGIPARTKIGIDSRELVEINEGVVETLLQIVGASPGTRWKTTGSAWEIRGTRKTVKTIEIGAASLPLIQREIDQITVSVLKLMLIMPMYAHFSMLRR
jgi:hypothetical protein